MNSCHPLYVKSGTVFEAVCQSIERTSLTWVQKTPSSNLTDETLVPTIGQDFTIQSCTEEPSGFSQSTLSRFNMSLNTRGMYQCKNKDSSSSYAIWVTVLHSTLILIMYFLQY